MNYTDIKNANDLRVFLSDPVNAHGLIKLTSPQEIVERGIKYQIFPQNRRESQDILQKVRAFYNKNGGGEVGIATTVEPKKVFLISAYEDGKELHDFIAELQILNAWTEFVIKLDGEKVVDAILIKDFRGIRYSTAPENKFSEVLMAAFTRFQINADMFGKANSETGKIDYALKLHDREGVKRLEEVLKINRDFWSGQNLGK